MDWKYMKHDLCYWAHALVKIEGVDGVQATSVQGMRTALT